MRKVSHRSKAMRILLHNEPEVETARRFVLLIVYFLSPALNHSLGV